MSRSSSLTAAAIASAALVVSACGPATVTATGVASAVTTARAASTRRPAPVHTRVAATALARTLLGRAILPPGARSVTSPPASALRSSVERAGATDLEGMASRYAVSGDSQGQVMAYEAAHRPQGYEPAGSGTGSSGPLGGPQLEDVEEQLGGMPVGVETAELVISTLPLPAGGVGISVDAQVAWLPPKPAGLDVPATDTVAVVSVTERNLEWRKDPQLHLPAPRRVVITDPARVAGLRRVADHLGMAEPGFRPCPADFGTRYQLAFAPSAGAGADLVFTAGNCGVVQVTRGGRAVAVLADDAALSKVFARYLGT